MYEVKDFSKELEPFEFKLPDGSKYKLPPFGMCSSSEVQAMADAANGDRLEESCRLIARDDDKLYTALVNLPVSSLVVLMNAWRQASSVTPGESRG